ncbi:MULTISPECIES: MotA/TolQ/ExbB proton channel family protein [Reichenbachiella]|uniref:Outer membrane transport energization protein ExbB (TC 2.C.1.1.1) n=1 Tax=Reichenbachiella agariperforans TaxID=156994 RepID=A0A1M6SIZ6_REIAG|nr:MULTISPECIES: MotA/TolQ/ExbB proton channel family protein [Reichenbachiella]SHK44579.1 outer membrane transport energization protein ExbB (TC 2.C.1.1.1) [Reichenbachiella agariperforans]
MNTLSMVLVTLLQDVPVEEAAAAAVAADVSVLDLLFKGGYMILPIVLLSLVGTYILVERLMTIKAADQTPESLMDEVKQMVVSGKVSEAQQLCARETTPIAKMLEKGLSRIGNPLKSIEASIENVGKIEVYKLEKNLTLLATISGAAPMIGFLGTVTGMIQAFMSIAQEEGAVSPKLLSSGIYEAMITTAAGLFVGIISYIAYNFLITKVAKLIHKMEYTSINFIDLLQEPQK